MGVRLNKDIQQRLESEEYLESELQICKSRWEQYKLTGKTIDHEEVEAWVKSLQQTEGVST